MVTEWKSQLERRVPTNSNCNVLELDTPTTVDYLDSLLTLWDMLKPRNACKSPSTLSLRLEQVSTFVGTRFATTFFLGGHADSRASLRGSVSDFEVAALQTLPQWAPYRRPLEASVLLCQFVYCNRNHTGRFCNFEKWEMSSLVLYILVGHSLFP